MQPKKRIKPSRKEKRHYLVLVATSADKQKIAGFCRQWKIRFILVNDERSKMIISALTKEVQAVKNALADAGFKCVGVSGTIKKAMQKFTNK